MHDFMEAIILHVQLVQISNGFKLFPACKILSGGVRKGEMADSVRLARYVLGSILEC